MIVIDWDCHPAIPDIPDKKDYRDIGTNTRRSSDRWSADARGHVPGGWCCFFACEMHVLLYPGNTSPVARVARKMIEHYGGMKEPTSGPSDSHSHNTIITLQGLHSHHSTSDHVSLSIFNKQFRLSGQTSACFHHGGGKNPISSGRSRCSGVHPP